LVSDWSSDVCSSDLAHATFHSAQEEMERLQAKSQTAAAVNAQPASESAQESKAA